jgi:hypothetical protein
MQLNDEGDQFLAMPTSSYSPKFPVLRSITVESVGKIDRTCDPCLSFMCCDNNFLDEVERGERRVLLKPPLQSGLTQERISRLRSYRKTHDSFRNCSICSE